MTETLQRDADEFGLYVYGDGASILKHSLTNVLVGGASTSAVPMNIIDAAKHMAKGGKKCARYLAKKYMPMMETVDPTHDLFDLCIFDGAGNVQKKGGIVMVKVSKVTLVLCFLAMYKRKIVTGF